MPNPRTWTLPADLEAAVSATLREWSEAGQGRAALGARRHPLDGRRRGELARVARDRRRAAGAGGRAPAHRRGRPAGGLHARPAARDGRLEPLPRGPPHDVRHAPGWPELSVLDSTDPAQVRAAEARVDLGRTLFVVSSKSGTTLEPNIFKQYFFERVTQAVGPGQAGDRFIAITDPGSKLEQVARADGFRHVVLRAAVDRRALLGAVRLRHGARRRSWGSTSRACSARRRRWRAPARPAGAPRTIPAPRWAPSWACSRRRGRDKVTLVASPGHPRSRRLARAAPGRVDGQGGQGPDPGRPGAARRRPSSTARTACSSTCGSHSAPDAAQDRGVAGLEAAGAARGPDRGPGPRPDRARSSSAGSSRRPSPARSSGSTRSTSRTSRPARSRRGGSRTRSSRPDACRPRRRSSETRGDPALRRPAERGASWRRAAGRSRASCGRTSGGSGPATTRRSSPTSR